jgi:hypothetical protein
VTDKSELELRRQRAAKNQSLFREANERVEDLTSPASFADFICECTNERCDESVPLTIEEYEHVRADGNSFFVLPGHEVPRFEEVIEAADGRYVVVRKLGTGATVAEKLDPRNRPFRRPPREPQSNQ